MSEPALLRDAHFWIGCLALVVGFAAFAARKGKAVHRCAGAVFVAAMRLLTASGLWLSLAREILFTVFLSAIAFHAVPSGWAAAAMEKPRWWTRASPTFSGVIVIGATYSGMRAAAAPGRRPHANPSD